MTLTRRTPLRRGQPPKRKKRLPRKNEKRAARRFEQGFHSEAFVAWVRSLACCVSGESGTADDPIVCAHVRSRGAGGRWWHVVPMLASLHEEQHWIGMRRFEEKYSVRLEDIAAATAQRWMAFTRTEEVG